MSASPSTWFQNKRANLVTAAIGAFGALFAVVRIGELIMNKPPVKQDKMSFFDLIEIHDSSSQKFKLRVLKTAGCGIVLGLGIAAVQNGNKSF